MVIPKLILMMVFSTVLKTEPCGNNGAACPALSIFAIPEKLQRAGRDATCLFLQSAGCFSPNRYAHSLHPVSHGLPQLNLPTAGPNRLRLKIKQNHASARSKRYTVFNDRVSASHRSGLNDQGYTVPAALPDLVVGQFLVRQASKAEAGVRYPNLLPFVCEHFSSDIYE